MIRSIRWQIAIFLSWMFPRRLCWFALGYWALRHSPFRYALDASACREVCDSGGMCYCGQMMTAAKRQEFEAEAKDLHFN